MSWQLADKAAKNAAGGAQERESSAPRSRFTDKRAKCNQRFSLKGMAFKDVPRRGRWDHLISKSPGSPETTQPLIVKLPPPTYNRPKLTFAIRIAIANFTDSRNSLRATSETDRCAVG